MFLVQLNPTQHSWPQTCVTWISSLLAWSRRGVRWNPARTHLLEKEPRIGVLPGDLCFPHSLSLLTAWPWRVSFSLWTSGFPGGQKGLILGFFDSVRPADQSTKLKTKGYEEIRKERKKERDWFMERRKRREKQPGFMKRPFREWCFSLEMVRIRSEK